MKDAKILYNKCGSGISQYYDEGYKGHEGMCLVCKVDFPLE